MAAVRKWICCDEAYKEIQAILQARLDGQISSEHYGVLENIDRFCALMLRIGHTRIREMANETGKSWRSLGYDFWLKKARERKEMGEYIARYWDTATQS